MSKIHYYCRQAASTTKFTNICPQQETTDLEEQLNDLYCIYTHSICFNINGNIIVEPAFYTFMLHTHTSYHEYIRWSATDGGVCMGAQVYRICTRTQIVASVYVMHLYEYIYIHKA